MTAPNFRTGNQIDHISIEKRAIKLITKVKSLRLTEYNLDHYLVRIVSNKKPNEKEHCSMNKRNTANQRKYKNQLFKDENVAKEHEQK